MDTDSGCGISLHPYLIVLSSLEIKEYETVNCFCNCVAGGGTGVLNFPGWSKCKASPHLLVIKPLWAADSGQHGQTLQERAPAAFRLYLIGTVKHPALAFVSGQSCLTMKGANFMPRLFTMSNNGCWKERKVDLAFGLKHTSLIPWAHLIRKSLVVLCMIHLQAWREIVPKMTLQYFIPTLSAHLAVKCMWNRCSLANRRYQFSLSHPISLNSAYLCFKWLLVTSIYRGHISGTIPCGWDYCWVCATFTKMFVVVHLKIHICVSEDTFFHKKQTKQFMVHVLETGPAGHSASG